MSQELQDYIAQARKAGKSDEEIVKGLLDNGWKHNDVVSALRNEENKPNIKTPTPHQKSTKLGKIGQLAIVTLGISFYIVAFSLIAVLNVFILLTGNSIWNDERIILILLVFMGLPVLLLILSGFSVVYKGELAPFGFLSDEPTKKYLNNIGWFIIGIPPILFIIMIVMGTIERML